MIALLAWLTGCGAPPPAPAPAPAPPPAPAAPEPPPAPEPELVLLTVPKETAEIAAKLVLAEDRIADPGVPDATAAEWGHAMQRILRALADDKVLARDVLAQVPDEARRAELQAVLDATREIGLTVTRAKPDLPDWRIVPPEPVPRLRAAYEKAGAEFGVPWTVLAAIHLVETKLGRLRGVSVAGAQGPMQFMPKTWEAYGLGGDVNDPDAAIRGAANYVAKSGWAKDPRKAIWHYNHSEHYVNAVLGYADWLARDDRRLRGVWGWQVYYRTVRGPVLLSEGYASDVRQPIEAWCASRDEIHCPRTH